MPGIIADVAQDGYAAVTRRTGRPKGDEMAKAPKTHVLMTVDDSASMNHLATDTRGGFNGYVEELRKDKDSRYRLTVAKFGERYELLAKAAKLSEVPALNEQNYRANQGSTALLDAIGKIISDFENGTTLRDGEKVLLVVQTDGLENSSKEFTVEQVRKMIQEREQSGRWQCIFLGAGPDAWKQGAGFGFAGDSILRTENTAAGTRSTYSGLATASAAYSKGASRGATVAAIQDALGDD